MFRFRQGQRLKAESLSK